jgi:translation initiation factor 1A
MPKNTSSKNKKGGSQVSTSKRELMFKTDMEEYAKISKMLGNSRVMVILPDSSEIMGIIPGRFRKRCWMAVNDIVLISRRDFQDAKVDIVYKYENDEPNRLLKYAEIPGFFVDDTLSTDNNNIDGLIITNEEDDNIEVNFDDI